MKFTIKDVEEMLTEDVMKNYNVNKTQANKLVLEALCRKPVMEAINKTIKFLANTSINKR